MRDELTELLEWADLALASCTGVIEDRVLDPLIEAVRAVRTRLAYPDEVMVVALAGGTGSGKSSLFNALAGAELVDVGGMRPTTSHAAAAIPSSAGESVEGYLDRLGIGERHVYEGMGLCLLDLPDTDSVETEHRHRADVLLPLVDVVLWVTDPEKYRDARLHEEYLAPMGRYSEQLIVVLNQIDRLDATDLDDVLVDLETALDEDLLEDVVVVPIATAPPSGPPIGIDELRSLVEEKRANRHNLYSKLLTDLEETSGSLSAEAGSGLDFDARADVVLAQAVSALTEDRTGEAGDILTEFLDALADDAGGPTGEKLMSIAADIPAHMLRIEKRLPPARPGRRRGFLRRRHPGPDDAPDRVSLARMSLSEAAIRPARAVLARRALAVASVAEFAVEVEDTRRRAGLRHRGSS